MHKRRSLASALLLAAFFVAFHWKVPRAHFGDDEPMNMYFNWSPALGKIILSNLMFWGKTVRPMAAIYYRPVYALFGLNPVPFHYVRLAMLAVNTALFYFLARRITRSWWVATAAAFPVAYHGNLAIVAYDGAFIYDVLCGGFFFAALLYYMRQRKRGPLGVGPALIFLVLYICALDSKEMAVSLPVLILAYELLFHGRKAALWPCAAAVAITLAFLAGRVLGAGGLASLGGYQPVFTWGQFSDQSKLFLNTIFYTNRFNITGVLVLWAILLYVAVRQASSRRDPRWLFLWIWVTVTPLPVAFLRDRGGGTLYLVAAGWAMLAGLALRGIFRAISREPFLAWVPRPALMNAGLLIFVAAFAHECRHTDRHDLWWDLGNGEQTQNLIDQLRSLRIHPPHGSRVVFLNDPFPTSYSTLFVASLVWGDPSLDINLQNRYPLPPDQVAQRDYILDYAGGRVVLLKPIPVQ
jgi:hypothetical protein